MMAGQSVSVTIRVSDLASLKLTMIQLRFLADKMRVEACPHVDELEHILGAFIRPMSDGGADDGAEDPR